MMVHTEIHELFTIPALIAHYISHKKENPKQSITDFLLEHYTTEKYTHTNPNEHKKLPFKHDKVINPVLFSCFQSYILAFEYNFIPKIRVFVIHKADLPHLMLGKGIWQPPRM